jgi:hypothetical protein
MSALILTDQERSAFCRESTRGWALDYFYTFDNVPLHFIYRDRVDHGSLSELEKRNKAITEGIWLDAYNLSGVVCTIHYIFFLYRPDALMLPLQAFLYGSAQPRPISEDDSKNRLYRTAEQLKADLDAWMTKDGWALVEKLRKEPPTVEWEILLAAPDRTMRIVSIMPFGNQVIVECIVTWTEEGVIKETAFAVPLLYDIDGTVLIDRSYCDLINWPSSPAKLARQRSLDKGRHKQGQTKGALDTFFNRYQNRKVHGDLTALELRNKEFIENQWVAAYNNGTDSVFHKERYRRQLPLQKVSYNLEVSSEIEVSVREQFPDRRLRTVFTYAKGNQVVAECIMSWTEDNVYKEAPFISFLLFDKEGYIIRDRSYITLEHWPGASSIAQKLRLELPH